jgi:hypothetical protein
VKNNEKQSKNEKNAKADEISKKINFLTFSGKNEKMSNNLKNDEKGSINEEKRQEG